MKKNYKKGFTLIELLVVIAIIGILASVILASLDSARAKGTDAATKSDLDNARAQAELFYDSNNSYAGVCAAPVSTNGIAGMLADAATKFNGSTPVVSSVTTAATATTAGTATTVICHDTATAWAAAVPLKSVTGSGGVVQYFCVDSTGSSKQDGTTLSATAPGSFVCQ